MTTRRRAKSAENHEKNKPRHVSHKTENQKDYIVTIVENDIIFCTGPSGTGKSYISAGIAAEKLHNGDIDQIVVTRPLVCAGKDMGAFPGDVKEKVSPYQGPIEEKLRFFLRGHYNLYVNDNRIRYEPLELMRGATYDNAYMILDEAQNCTSDQIKMFITRMGLESKVLINGDTNQTDLDGHSGLAYSMNKLEKVDGVGRVKLEYKDIQRNGILGRVLSALEDVPDYNNENDYDDDEY